MASAHFFWLGGGGTGPQIQVCSYELKISRNKQRF